MVDDAVTLASLIARTEGIETLPWSVPSVFCALASLIARTEGIETSPAFAL